MMNTSLGLVLNRRVSRLYLPLLVLIFEELGIGPHYCLENVKRSREITNVLAVVKIVVARVIDKRENARE